MKFTPRARNIIIERAGQACERCGKPARGGSIHHRRPRGMGGTKDPASGSVPNGVLVCGSGTTGCHGWIETHRTDALELGWLVRQGANPANIPIPHATLGQVWLDPEGMYLHAPPAYSLE